MAVDATELEQTQDSVQAQEAAETVVEPEAAESGGASQADAEGQAGLASQDQQLAQREDAAIRELGELRKQLSRLESRFDRGGQDAAQVKDIHRRIGQLETLQDEIADLKETQDAFLAEQLGEEAFGQLKRNRDARRTQRELDRTKKERDALLSTFTVRPTQEQQPQPDSRSNQEQITQVEARLAKRIQKAGYDPADKGFVDRLSKAVGDPNKLTLAQLEEAVVDAVLDFASQDRQATAQGARRTEARSAVQTDRARSGASGNLDDDAFLVAYGQGKINDHERAQKLLGM